MAHGAGGEAVGRQLLDLVCGPISPLPETYQRYRLVAHLGSGGQAEVYRAVRLSGGVSSAPMTVKVFRIDPRRPLIDEMRSWDKGDAALMDLNNRGVTGICRRADGFYGPQPHLPGRRPPQGDAVPYQVYDYLHGINLREYVQHRAGLAPGGVRLGAVAALRTLAVVLRALHNPQQTGATPVLHMDVKPSNVMVLANGEVRLIDFTGARYWRSEEITQIAYTPESGGPEAFGGVSQLSPAYDVHGFGAVAYHLVTGEYPREPGGSVSVPRRAGATGSALRRHATLEHLPELRDHLHAPLADRPGDRPSTVELLAWVDRLGELVRRVGALDIGMDWAEPAESSTELARASSRAAAPVAGTETNAFQRIEKLERALVELRSAVGVADCAPGAVPAVTGKGVNGSHPGAEVVALGLAWPAAGTGTPAPGTAGPPILAPTWVVDSGSPAAPSPPGTPVPGGSPIQGRASVPTPRPRAEPTGVISEDVSARPRRQREDPRLLKRGWELSGIGAVFAFICWAIMAIAALGNLTVPLVWFMIVLVVAAGVFALTRLVGRIILVDRLGRTRHGAKGAHATTGLFLLAAGVNFLGQTPWVVHLYNWLMGLR